MAFSGAPADRADWWSRPYTGKILSLTSLKLSSQTCCSVKDLHRLSKLFSFCTSPFTFLNIFSDSVDARYPILLPFSLVICTEVASSPTLRTVEFRHGLGCCMNRWKVGIVYNGSRRGIDTRRTLGLIICPNSRQSTTYCGGVDIPPSIDRLTHVVHGLYWQLDSPVGQSRAPLFLLLSWTSDVGVSRPGLCRTS